MDNPTPSEPVIKALNSFLRGEISAVETYYAAIDRINDNPTLRQRLRECQRSHQMRIDALRQNIRSLGGVPSASSGAWGSFAKLLEDGAAIFGEKAAISALEEGEDHGRNDYKRDLDKLDDETRRFIQTSILPEQERTHDLISALEKSLA